MRKFPTCRQVDEMKQEINDLKEALFNVKNWVMPDGSPCWCLEYENSDSHSPTCMIARQVTEPFWKKVDTESKH